MILPITHCICDFVTFLAWMYFLLIPYLYTYIKRSSYESLLLILQMIHWETMKIPSIHYHVFFYSYMILNIMVTGWRLFLPAASFAMCLSDLFA